MRKIVDVMRFMDEKGPKWACRYLEESYELAVRALERLGLQRFLDLYEKLEDSYVECAVDEARAKRNYRLKLRGWVGHKLGRFAEKLLQLEGGHQERS
jgi:hypothetical protein